MNANERELILMDEVYQIVGAAMEVSNQLGCGFLEAVYQEALEIELVERRIPHVPPKADSDFLQRQGVEKGVRRGLFVL